MKITIGLPFFNAEEYLSLAIYSVLNQNYRDFELILSDDGSTDHSLNIAKMYKDPRIVIVADKKNKGLPYRLNEQVKLAKGEYFVRMDADDIMFPDRLYKQLNFLEKNPEIDIVGSNIVVINEVNEILGIREYRLPNSNIDLFYSIPFAHPSVMGRTAWFMRHKYNEGLNGYEDSDLWIRSYNESKFGLLKEPLIFYRDSLNLKLRVVIYRHKQARVACRNYSLSILPVFSRIIFLTISYIKSCIYWLSFHMNLAKYILSSRNLPISEKEKGKYLQLLKLIILHDLC